MVVARPKSRAASHERTGRAVPANPAISRAGASLAACARFRAVRRFALRGGSLERPGIVVHSWFSGDYAAPRHSCKYRWLRAPATNIGDRVSDGEGQRRVAVALQRRLEVGEGRFKVMSVSE